MTYVRISLIEREEKQTVPEGKGAIDTAGTVAFVVLYGLLVVLSFFFYDSANLEVPLYLGWGILIVGIVFLFLGSRSRRRARESGDKGESKGALIESGMYAFVRHPEFLGHMLIFVALVLITQYWASILLGVMLVVLLYLTMLEEEKGNLEKFGDAYKRYMRRVPRINLIAGIMRQKELRRRKKEG
jgi:protein-S-isoprenylcysteine O-methyltransferase Ste14